jgi:hypothetical protein
VESRGGAACGGAPAVAVSTQSGQNGEHAGQNGEHAGQRRGGHRARAAGDEETTGGDLEAAHLHPPRDLEAAPLNPPRDLVATTGGGGALAVTTGGGGALVATTGGGGALAASTGGGSAPEATTCGGGARESESSERERRVRELVEGGDEGAGQRPLRAWAWGGVSAESSPAHLRSSNRASLPGRAESSFPYEVGNAQVGITGLTNS